MFEFKSEFIEAALRKGLIEERNGVYESVHEVQPIDFYIVHVDIPTKKCKFRIGWKHMFVSFETFLSRRDNKKSELVRLMLFHADEFE